jgi:hypothetical protein
VNSDFLQIQRSFLFYSSGVFHPFKGCSNRLHLKLLFAPWASRGLGSLLVTYGRLLPITLGPYSRLVSLEITQCFLGPSWAVVLWAFPKSCHLPSFGLTADDSCGLLLVCHSFGKKWASTLAPRAHASKCTHVRRG